MNTIDLAWSAGIYEGEGYVGFKSNPDKKKYRYPRIQVQIVMTDEDVIQRLKDIWGGSVWEPKIRGDQRKQTYQWTVSQQKAFHFLMKIYPMLGKRRKEQVRGALVPYVEYRWRAVF
jgi:hypothetical protein